MESEVIIVMAKPSFMNKEGKIVRSHYKTVNGQRMYFAYPGELLNSQIFPSERTPTFVELGKYAESKNTKYLPGDVVYDKKRIYYRLVLSDRKGQIGDGPEFQIYGGCRLCQDAITLDRRFMEVKTTKNVIGRFIVYPLFEDEITLHRHRELPMMVDPKNIVRDINNAIFKFNSEKYPLVANVLIISYDRFQELTEYYSNNGGPLKIDHNMTYIRFKELRIYRSEDAKKEQFIIMSDGK